jgi:DNA polymerase IV
MFCHIDADAFFASVLQRKYPKYKGKPLIALGMGGSSVISASYECKAKKVRTGMRLHEAKLLCPEAIAIPSDFTETALASQQIQTMLYEIAPIIEQASIDEWYVDLQSCVGGTPNNITDWAITQQKQITQSTDIPVSLGIAPTKLLAKMASDYRKPKGVTVIVDNNLSSRASDEGRNSTLRQAQGDNMAINDFLKDRPCAAIPGIGSKRQTHAQAFHWETAYDFAYAEHSIVQTIFGRPGIEMQQELQGKVVHTITMEYVPPKSISRCRSFKPTNSKDVILAYLLHHLSYTIIKLRRHQLMCKWIAVSMRNHEYKHIGKDYKLPLPMDTEAEILPYALRLFEKLYVRNPRCTQIGLTLGMFSSKAAKQFSLFEDPNEHIKDDTIQKTLDELHTSLGRDSIMRGSALPIKSGVNRGLPMY